MLRKLVIISLVLVLFHGCEGSIDKQPEQAVVFHSFRDIPGITADEIKSIEELQEQKASFVFGTTLSTEAFLTENGEIGGYVVLLCDWLTRLFGIRFTPDIYVLSDLLAKLTSEELDFGIIRDSEERKETYYLTEPIGRRMIKIIRIEGSRSINRITLTRLPRYVFLQDSTTFDIVSSVLDDNSYDALFAADYDAGYEMLKNGEADAFLEAGIAEAAFDRYSDVYTEDFLPLLFNSAVMATANPQLAPVISIVTKAVRSGGILHLNELYRLGDDEYRKHKYFMQLTEEEKEYLHSTSVVPLAACHWYYPVSYFNKYEGKWEGIAFDVFKEVEKFTGLSFEVAHDQYTKWPAMLDMLQDGRAHVISDLIITEGRKEYYIWAMNGFLSGKHALLSKRNFPNISLADIPYARIALIEDTGYAEVFNDWFPNCENTKEYATIDDAFYAVERGEADLVMASTVGLSCMTNYYEFSSYKANFIFNDEFTYNFGFNKDQGVLCSIVDKALPLIDVNTIVDQWMTQTYDYRAMLLKAQRPWLLGAICMVLIVLALVFIFWVKSRSTGKRLERQVQKRTAELKKQHSLMNAVNNAAVLLLESNAENYLDALNLGMDVFCRHMGAARVYLWQNFRKEDGKLYCKQAFKWTDEGWEMDSTLVEFAYHDILPKWEGLLSMGNRLNGPLDEIPEGDRSFFSAYRLQSLLVVPLFLKGDFWGFASCDDCRRRRTFHKAEEHALQIWGLLAMGAIQRGEIAQGMRKTLTVSIELQRKLEVAIEAANTANRYKSAFLANMSHEIRTPLNVIIGLTDLILEENNLSAYVLENLHKICNAGDTLLGIVNDILDFSKIESGKLTLVPVEYHISSLLNDVITLMVTRLGEKPVDFRLNISEDLPDRLFGDDLRVKQIFNNLLSNALKYTTTGTIELTVSCNINDKNNVWMEITVSDTGIGISEEDQKKLFSDYYQVENRANRSIEGTGLGLSITRKLAELMNGEVAVESELGKGSVFRVRICQGFAGDSKIGAASAEKLINFRYAEDKRIVTKKLVRHDLSYARVLVVDDMQTNLDVTSGLLRKYKMQVDCVSGGQEAIEKIRLGKPVYNAIFMDHMMPGMDGIEAADAIRELGDEYARSIPIIALTANAIQGTRDIFYEHDFQDFLSKPIDIMLLDSIVKKWIR